MKELYTVIWVFGAFGLGGIVMHEYHAPLVMERGYSLWILSLLLVFLMGIAWGRGK